MSPIAGLWRRSLASSGRPKGSGEWAGKAGAYAIQGRAQAFIEHLSGSYSGVMGLPLFETGGGRRCLDSTCDRAVKAPEETGPSRA
jgi:hypothetical protein